MSTSAANASPAIEIDAAKRKLVVAWGDGERNGFHFVWLRHAARCGDGMPNDTRVKIDLLPDDPAELAIAAARIDGEYLVVEWGNDRSTSRHRLDILRRSAYDAAARAARKHRPTLWDRDSAAAIPCFDAAALGDDRGILDLLLAVRDFGIARVRGVPTEAGSIAAVATLFGPIHVNNYGRVFDVRSDANLGLGSNTGDGLPPHTDESYRHDAPGISLFHCLAADADGGDSILVDGFMAAARLREQDPAAFDVLAEVPLFFRRHAPPREDMQSHARALVLDIDGDVVGVRWTDRTLPPQDLPDERVEPVYRALRRMWRIVNDEALQLRYRMAPGDLHVFDNHRVLHGRLGFDAATGARHLQQCSVNRDEFHNRLRLLAARLGDPAAELVMAGGALG